MNVIGLNPDIANGAIGRIVADFRVVARSPVLVPIAVVAQ
jgi:hypothetical protein